jgi:hypothetical protein
MLYFFFLLGSLLAMANKLVSSLFATGPKDNLAALDVYKATGRRNINSIQELSQQAGVNLTSIIGQRTGGNKALAGLLTKVAGNVKVDTSMLRDRITSGVAGVKGTFQDLSENAKNSLTGGLDGLKGTMQVSMGGVTSTIPSSQFQDVSSFGNFINDYTQSSSFNLSDRDGLASVISGSIGQASSFGIPNAFSTLTDGIEDQVVMCKVVNQTVPSLVKNQDIDTLFDMSNSRAGKTMSAVFPNFAGDISRSFRFPTNQGPARKADAFSKLVGTLTNVNPRWNQSPRQKGNDIALNLLTLLGASDDFKLAVQVGIALMPDRDAQKNYALANVYRPTTVEAEIRKYFPRVVLQTPSNAITANKKKPLDPRLLRRGANVVGKYLFED